MVGKIGSSPLYTNYATLLSQKNDLTSLVGKMPEGTKEEAISEIRELFALSKAQEVTYQMVTILLDSLKQNGESGGSINIYA